MELMITSAEWQRSMQAIDCVLAKAESLTAQLESGEKSAAVIPTIRAHIEAARKLAGDCPQMTPARAAPAASSPVWPESSRPC